MTAYANWTEGTVYNFSTISSPALPRTYSNVKLIAMGTFSAAQRFAASQLYVQWRAVYPSLPVGTPDNPDAARWLVFESASKEVIVLADYWVDGSNVQPQTFSQASILVTETSSADIAVLRDFMNRRQMKYTIEFKQG